MCAILCMHAHAYAYAPGREWFGCNSAQPYFAILDHPSHHQPAKNKVFTILKGQFRDEFL